MSPLQRLKPFLHQDQELLRAFRERPAQTEPNLEHGQRRHAITRGRSANPNPIPMSLQNFTQEARLNSAQFLDTRDPPRSQRVPDPHRDQAQERTWRNRVRRLL
jgi:hypothetical protein